ncbi:CDP-alcohol phosphatidyltransferase family protein [Teredinibacter sp. KSP-S5-2]|uniref:CDP-alcohol phosphatidyltransferase family protein n=1 Tax=Teredinibacter sp. KSP-S5-2 TaxID=3034506 RepID=UPI00293441B2|nr:CDP-alcohol phosphatidyltransferase family protein [Teredinibacter sp. KSP-S5-2]WNO08360.1 CDP-alcohol phosphatidyltransferase family protein [Teredinibacter sp. KSP-S5-2]
MNSTKIKEKSLYLAAWFVHLFSALGILCGFQACVAIAQAQWMTSLFWLLLALIIDAVDGTFARLFRVKDRIPNIDGKMLDYVIDFVNFVFLPAFFIYSAIDLPEQYKNGLICLIFLASCYHYANLKAVYKDQYFVGFPAFWNLIAFYLFITELSSFWNSIVIVIISTLHFIPIKVIYLSRMFKSNIYAIMLAGIWAASTLMTIINYPTENFIWAELSLTIAVLIFIFSNISMPLRKDKNKNA